MLQAEPEAGPDAFPELFDELLELAPDRTQTFFLPTIKHLSVPEELLIVEFNFVHAEPALGEVADCAELPNPIARITVMAIAVILFTFPPVNVLSRLYQAESQLHVC